MEQYWLLNILAFLATYSYCLFASIFLAHNQIGLKLISPILMMSIFVIFSLQFSESGLIRFEMISPHARLILLAFSSTSSEIYSLVFTINQYIIVFLYQFFIPLSSAIIFELIKIYRFELLKKLNEDRYKKPTGEQIIIELEQIQVILSKPIIKLKNISKSYGFKLVLKDISVTIDSGEIITVYGQNATGKTTLINIISNV